MYLNQELFHQLIKNGRESYDEHRFCFKEKNHELDNSILAFFTGRPLSKKYEVLAITEISKPWKDYVLIFWDTEDEKTKWCHLGDTIYDGLVEEWGEA